MPKNIITIKDQTFLFNNDVMVPIDPNKVYEVIEKRTDKRTVLQNSAMHQYFKMVAEALNDAGYSVPFVMNKKNHAIINKVFAWAKDVIPQHAHETLEKMKQRILQSGEDEMSWTMILVKELLWKEIQNALLSKPSTSALNKDEIDIVYNNLNAILSKRFGVSVPFPSIDSMIFQQNYANK